MNCMGTISLQIRWGTVFVSQSTCAMTNSQGINTCGEGLGTPRLPHANCRNKGWSGKPVATLHIERFRLWFSSCYGDGLRRKKESLGFGWISSIEVLVSQRDLVALAPPLSPQPQNDNWFDRYGSPYLEHDIYLEEDRVLTPPEDSGENEGSRIVKILQVWRLIPSDLLWC